MSEIYLDYMATTPVDPRVAEALTSCLTLDGCFGNPASIGHRFGWEAAEKVDHARQQVAALINADPREITFTSGATEANNLAIKGAAFMYQRKGKHIITMSTEHKAVLDPYDFLASEGFETSLIKPLPNGLLNFESLMNAIRPDTILVSIMQVNNETGVIQDIAKIGEYLENKGIIFHVDAAQSVGKFPVDVGSLKCSTLAISGHKMYAPKGIGALFVCRSPRIRLMPQIHGGGHERGLRSGTLATHQIAAFGKAAELALLEMPENQAHARKLMGIVMEGLAKITGIRFHGDLTSHLPNCINFGIDDVDRELLLLKVSNLALSTGSACNSTHPEPSHVLSAMGLNRDQANHAIRLSVGKFTTEADIAMAVKSLQEAVDYLRKRE
jgi:cysteine desulfurase